MNVAGAPAPVFDERFELYSPGVGVLIGKKYVVLASAEKRGKLLVASMTILHIMLMIEF